MTDPYKHSGGDTEGAVNPDTDNLRAKSDALLERCGWKKDDDTFWSDQFGMERPHPYANAQDAIDLAEAMGLRVQIIAECVPGVRGRTPTKYFAVLCRNQFRFSSRGTTYAEAICATITEAVKPTQSGDLK